MTAQCKPTSIDGEQAPSYNAAEIVCNGTKMAKKTAISKFEALAQGLIEGSLGRLLGGSVTPADIAAQLMKVMEDSQLNGAAADTYRVRLHPNDHALVLETYPQLAEELQALILTMAQQVQLQLLAVPQVILLPAEEVGRHEIRVQAMRQQQKRETTQLRPPAPPAAEAIAALTRLDAYLVVDGRHHIPLHKPIINIGRRTDNDIVLDAPTVSRSHAQLRWRYGRFILYDLSQRHGRTSVNGQAVTECVLQPGDVIRLSEVNLLYAEGETVPKRGAVESAGETQVMRPPSDGDESA